MEENKEQIVESEEQILKPKSKKSLAWKSTPARQEAFKKAQMKRQENIKQKKEIIKQKSSQNLEGVETGFHEESEEEPIKVIQKPKSKSKPKIIYESDSSSDSDESVEYVIRKNKKRNIEPPRQQPRQPPNYMIHFV